MRNCLFLLLISFLLSACVQKSFVKPPNVIIILTDDQGWGDLSCNGNTNLHTPNIDKLATRGITFKRFYVCPVCSPTRAEILTGRYHVRSGVWSTSTGGERIDTDETTIAELFKAAGYATAAYGKWHNGIQAPYHPNSRGFDDFYGFCSGHWGNYHSPMLEHNGEIVQGNGFIIDDFTNHGLNFIEQNKNKPFFLFLPFNTPHSPMQVPQKYWNRFKNKKLELFYHSPEKEAVDFTRAALAMCENIDWNVGRITDKLEELQLTENTIVVFLSDNGPNAWRWNDGMKGKKGSTDEGGVRSPMIITWESKLKGNTNINTIAGGIDLLPTLIDLAKIETIHTKPLDGVSLKPLLYNENPQWPNRNIFSYWNGQTSLRNQQFRLDADNKLFDMKNDPGQTLNVADSFPDIHNQLVTAKNNWNLQVLSELDADSPRPFPIGHPSMPITQLPARDGIGYGNITRSNKYPNSTYFTNWIATTDKITFDTEIIRSGNYEVELFYTCPQQDVGSKLLLSCERSTLKFQINEAFESSLLDKDDIYPRMEGYVKAFHRKKIGRIYLEQGRNKLTLHATDIPGSQVMDFRLLLFRKI
ncbi:arylsulfatase [uncultured Draconibacterium sp.]|uniref:arylsulfatase n=1 Tax=uncultured Draconibacterium sp. TaxID=1573823 RepID=UPI003260617D